MPSTFPRGPLVFAIAVLLAAPMLPVQAASTPAELCVAAQDDAGSGGDAPSKAADALHVHDATAAGCLGGGDTHDAFAFDVVGGHLLRVTVDPSDHLDVRLWMYDCPQTSFRPWDSHRLGGTESALFVPRGATERLCVTVSTWLDTGGAGTYSVRVEDLDAEGICSASAEASAPPPVPGPTFEVCFDPENQSDTFTFHAEGGVLTRIRVTPLDWMLSPFTGVEVWDADTGVFEARRIALAPDPNTIEILLDEDAELTLRLFTNWGHRVRSLVEITTPTVETLVPVEPVAGAPADLREVASCGAYALGVDAAGDVWRFDLGGNAARIGSPGTPGRPDPSKLTCDGDGNAYTMLYDESYDHVSVARLEDDAWRPLLPSRSPLSGWAFAFGPDGALHTASRSHAVWDCNARTPLREATPLEPRGSLMRFAPDGSAYLFNSGIHRVDLESGEGTQVLSHVDSGYQVKDLEFDAHGRLFFTVEHDQILRRYDPTTGAIDAMARVPSGQLAIVDGALVAASRGEGALRVMAPDVGTFGGHFPSCALPTPDIVIDAYEPTLTGNVWTPAEPAGERPTARAADVSDVTLTNRGGGAFHGSIGVEIYKAMAPCDPTDASTCEWSFAGRTSERGPWAADETRVVTMANGDPVLDGDAPTRVVLLVFQDRVEDASNNERVFAGPSPTLPLL